jgi:hypothetical protein
MHWQFPWRPRSTDVNDLIGNSQSNRIEEVDPDLKLPKRASLSIIIAANTLLQVSARYSQTSSYFSDRQRHAQVSFFIIVSSSNEYALYLDGTSTFSGVVIGIPTVFAGLSLLPLMRFDKGKSPL